MQTHFCEARMEQLARARAFVALDARPITVQRLTGLLSPDLHQWFYRNAEDAQRGRAPRSAQWYSNANLLQQLDANVFCALFNRLYQRGFAADEALLSAFLAYLELDFPHPRVDFDRAFDLASHIVGRWLTNDAHFWMVTCRHCGCDALTEKGLRVPLHCPCCRLIKRYTSDPRLRSHVPDPAAQRGPAPLLGISRLSAPAGPKRPS
ncbi:hypothetical protein SN15_03165 [Stenotrophomonas maltophilia]|nr:hypothetical protein SN15_03165 [Stenotrophomonas maltophilia]